MYAMNISKGFIKTSLGIAVFIVILFSFYYHLHVSKSPIPNQENGFSSILNTYDGDMVYGSSTSPLEVIEYYDLECPYCRNLHFEINKNLSLLDGLRYVYRPFPLSDLHPGASKKNLLLLCGTYQERNFFISAMEYAYEHLDISIEDYKAYLMKLVSNKDSFQECYERKEFGDAIIKSVADGRLLGVYGTPTLVLVDRTNLKYKIFHLVGAAQGVYILEAFIAAGRL
jgi:protein-disulfide isomerase